MKNKERIVTGHKTSSREPELEVPTLDIHYRCNRCEYSGIFNAYAGVPRCLFCTGAPILEAVRLVSPPDPLNQYMRDVDKWKEEVARSQNVN